MSVNSLVKHLWPFIMDGVCVSNLKLFKIHRLVLIILVISNTQVLFRFDGLFFHSVGVILPDSMQFYE